MDSDKLKDLLKNVADGRWTVDEAADKLKVLPFEDMGFARLDTHRAIRDNFPEVIYCPGKTPEEVAKIVERMNSYGHNILATRAEEEVYRAVLETTAEAEYHSRSKVITVVNRPLTLRGKAAIVTAGTADLPVAEEAAVCLRVMGVEAEMIADVGIAGIHRLLDRVQQINTAQVVIVVAGMEGALASVVGGLTSKPVIAVPTSVGYGANFHGLSALLTMLNSCAAGVGVVNIDNGFGAAALALSIVRVHEA